VTRLKLGILQTNFDTHPAIGGRYPDDAHRFRDLFDAQDQRFDYSVYMTVGGEVPADVDEQDAYLINGSPLSVLQAPAFLPPLYDFIRRCDAAQRKVLGVCFGHQAIAVALGGTVERTLWNVGIELTEFVQNGLTWPAATYNLYNFHHDAVTTLPDGATLIATSQGAPIAGFAKDAHILTLQAHPEFTDRFMRAVLDVTRPHLEDATYTAALKTLDLPNDGPAFAALATRFFGGTP